MIKKEMIKKITLFLLTSAFLVSGCDMKIEPFTSQGAPLASAVSFDSAKLIVLNTYNGKKIQPCIQTEGSNQYKQDLSEKNQNKMADRHDAQKCLTELVINGTDSVQNSALNSALELSKEIIKGTIKKDGKAIDARIVVTVTTLYKGSDCNTINQAGDQYENCGNVR